MALIHGSHPNLSGASQLNLLLSSYCHAFPSTAPGDGDPALVTGTFQRCQPLTQMSAYGLPSRLTISPPSVTVDW